MTAFVVGIADDEENIHNSIKEYLHIYDPEINIEEFYFASEVEDYLYENSTGLDILFLDQRFEGSSSGIESIPIIRKYAPKLPIVLLTGMDIDFSQLVALGEKYDVAYIPKPIDTKQLAMKIENVKYQTRKYAELQKSIDLSLRLLAKGNIAGLKEYIQKDLNDNEKVLIYNLENLLESIKICSKYEIIKQNLNNFAYSIKKYERSKSDILNNNVKKEKVYKAFSYIFENMQQLIEYKNKASCPCKIIKWCAANGYLQQAVTFYIEWLPVYLTESYLVEVKDENIIDTCNTNKHSWELWQRYFIRDFKYKNSSQITENSEAAFCHEVNIVIQRFKNFSELNPNERNKRLLMLAAESTLTGQLAKAILYFSEKANVNFAYEVLHSPNNIIFQILQNACPPNTSFVNFLNQRLKNEKDIKNTMIKAVIGVKKQKLREILGNKRTIRSVSVDSRIVNGISIDSNTSPVAKNYFDMIRDNAISISLPADNIINFSEQYKKYNKQYRNQINHANNSFDNESKASVIANSIIESVNLIDSEY